MTVIQSHSNEILMQPHCFDEPPTCFICSWEVWNIKWSKSKHVLQWRFMLFSGAVTGWLPSNFNYDLAEVWRVYIFWWLKLPNVLEKVCNAIVLARKFCNEVFLRETSTLQTKNICVAFFQKHHALSSSPDWRDPNEKQHQFSAKWCKSFSFESVTDVFCKKIIPSFINIRRHLRDVTWSTVNL